MLTFIAVIIGVSAAIYGTARYLTGSCENGWLQNYVEDRWMKRG